MKSSIIAIASFISLSWNLNAYAQTNDSLGKSKIDFSVLERRIQFSSKNELGGLKGIGRLKDASDYTAHNSEWALELTSTNGIQTGSFFAGIGTGVRYWGNSIVVPLFLHVSYDLLINRKIRGFFLHGDIGNQFGTRKSNSQGDKETGGFYAAYGLGYNIPVKKQTLYVKASMCHQRATAEGKFSGLGPSTVPEKYSLNYLFFRVSVGWRFTK
ncbi:hypothetical protein [Fluviicola chungangensis]|uniref:Outer membrane protein beta-barrel domain-containing protein n=1 Tax=Fluviicola chungangensis TaxID=2597671 RepID=A0A556N0G6_9FLAO|nr:hypothetical protein [Fluviicola chungangensis]TSJ45529.1 hypothetical protein FO442_07165 [Fluviicola chungangensis]